MNAPVPFQQVGRLPEPGDNVAIAVRRLEAGMAVAHGAQVLRLSHTVLEGHRFAVAPIAQGQQLLSWGLPFGVAVRAIAPGDYLCNARMLEALRPRHVGFPLPTRSNFTECLSRYRFDERAFQPAEQVPRQEQNRFFHGYARGSGRGVGTRNYLVLLGTTSLTASFVRVLAERFKDVPTRFPNIDGVVAVSHTEGGGQTCPNNFDLVVRTLAGFMVHANVGAVLAVDVGVEVMTNALLQRYLTEQGFPIAELPHRFLSLTGAFESDLERAGRISEAWLEQVNGFARSPQPLEHLRIGLQCGGSDAFSGVSGNPLAGWVTRELVRYGGGANLAETDELIGAESYVLDKVRDLDTARSFLATLERFQERAAWHGHTAEENPSGGNLFRGLYNIALKSIGAARKKDPAVRLDYVIDYAQRMTAPGFYFMDSPGNDLESVAGQVAAGCNLIVFTTGNGSITNFPFVPTIKVMTNTPRFNLLAREMDFNAGRYLDGTPMDELGKEAFEYVVRVASGARSVGEQAGHAQVQLWREWRQTDRSRLETICRAPVPTGQPVAPERLNAPACPGLADEFRFLAYATADGWACDRVGLIVPTSLCAGQVARLIVEQLNRATVAAGIPPALAAGVPPGGKSVTRAPKPGSQASGPNSPRTERPDAALYGGQDGCHYRYVALPHTEGCGVSSGDSEQLYLRTMAGYLRHPLVHRALVLEHGCEKTHNDAMRHFLSRGGIDPDKLGWASIQLDGGLERVTAKAIDWFHRSTDAESEPALQAAGLDRLRLGVMAVGTVPEAAATALAELALLVVHAGGTLVVPENTPLLHSGDFLKRLLQSPQLPAPTLSYGQPFTESGLHLMQTPTDHHVETLTGLGATGVEILLAHVTGWPAQGHPLVPFVQVCTSPSAEDFDLNMAGETEPLSALLKLLARVAAREQLPRTFVLGNTDFQMTRGWFGVSL